MFDSARREGIKSVFSIRYGEFQSRSTIGWVRELGSSDKSKMVLASIILGLAVMMPFLTILPEEFTNCLLECRVNLLWIVLTFPMGFIIASYAAFAVHRQISSFFESSVDIKQVTRLAFISHMVTPIILTLTIFSLVYYLPAESVIEFLPFLQPWADLFTIGDLVELLARSSPGDGAIFLVVIAVSGPLYVSGLRISRLLPRRQSSMGIGLPVVAIEILFWIFLYVSIFFSISPVTSPSGGNASQWSFLIWFYVLPTAVITNSALYLLEVSVLRKFISRVG